jgi:hypothetical protein
VWNWANVNQNPLKPLNGQTKLKVTSNVGSVVIEGFLDVSKLPNPTKISITGRLFSDEKIAINPDVRHKITVEPKKIPSGFDLSDRGETGNCCDCIYKVFADAENSDSYRNHVTSRWMIGETVTFELYKDGVLTAFVPTAQIFPNDTSAYYCTISWRDVLLTEGIGCYTLVGKSEVSGLEFEQTLGMFDLQQFTWERVDGLVCIRSVFNDANIQEQINFTNAIVMDCLLLDGDIEEYQPTTEINNLIKANRIQEKVKRENRTKWTINVDFADFCHMKRLTDVHLLGENQLFISDYRKDAFDKTILDKPVILSESISLTPLYRSERQKGSFQVENKIVDAISRFGFVNASGEVNLSEIPLPNLIDNPCEDATVTNSDESYVQTVASGDTLVLPDITVTDSDGSTFTQPSVENVVCTLSPDTELEVNGTLEGTFAAGSKIEVNITDGVNPVTPDAVTVVGDVVTIEVPSGGSGCTGTAGMYSTGQTVSFGDGDDSNINQDYWTLPTGKVNVWGHNFRWCGITGGYTDGVGYFDVDGVATTKVLAFPETLVCDLGHVDCDGNFPMYQYNFQLTTNLLWDIARATCIAFSTVSFPTGWRMHTRMEAMSLFYQPNEWNLQQKPFESPGPFYALWTGTTKSGTTNAYTQRNDLQYPEAAKGSLSARAFPARTTNISEL